jgi:hypothetical protein
VVTEVKKAKNGGHIHKKRKRVGVGKEGGRVTNRKRERERQRDRQRDAQTER